MGTFLKKQVTWEVSWYGDRWWWPRGWGLLSYDDDSVEVTGGEGVYLEKVTEGDKGGGGFSGPPKKGDVIYERPPKTVLTHNKGCRRKDCPPESSINDCIWPWKFIMPAVLTSHVQSVMIRHIFACLYYYEAYFCQNWTQVGSMEIFINKLYLETGLHQVSVGQWAREY